MRLIEKLVSFLNDIINENQWIYSNSDKSTQKLHLKEVLDILSVGLK